MMHFSDNFPNFHKLTSVTCVTFVTFVTFDRFWVCGMRFRPEGKWEGVSSLPSNCTDLSLRNKELSSLEGVSLANFLSTNSTLEELDLGWNSLDVEGAKAFSDALRVNATLTKLSLSGNKIGDEGVRILAQGIAGNSRLTDLDLMDTELGPPGFDALVTAISENKNSPLTRWNLTGNFSVQEKMAPKLLELKEIINLLYSRKRDSVNLKLQKLTRDYLEKVILEPRLIVPNTNTNSNSNTKEEEKRKQSEEEKEKEEEKERTQFLREEKDLQILLDPYSHRDHFLANLPRGDRDQRAKILRGKIAERKKQKEEEADAFLSNDNALETGKKDFIVLLNDDVQLFDSEDNNFERLNPQDLLEKSVDSLYKVYRKQKSAAPRRNRPRRIKFYFEKNSLYNPSEKTADQIIELLREGVLWMNWRGIEPHSKAYFRIVNMMLFNRIFSEEVPQVRQFFNTTFKDLGKDNLIIQKRIGGGNFGDVFLSIYEQTVPVVVKTLKSQEDASPEQKKRAVDNFLTEASIACRIPSHPLILKHYLLIKCPPPTNSNSLSNSEKEEEEEEEKGLDLIKGAQYLLVTDLAPFGSLDDYLYKERDRVGKIVDVLTRSQIALQIAGAVAHLHKHGFLHRDLAVRNVLVLSASPQVLLCDFGLTVYVNSVENGGHYLMPQRETAGLPLPVRTLPPEVLKPDFEGNLRFSFKSDVWAFGIFLFELFTFAEDLPEIVPVPFEKEGKKDETHGRLAIKGDYSKEALKNIPFLKKAPNLSALRKYLCVDCIDRREGVLSKPPLCPPEVYSVINSCLSFDPSARPSMEIVKRSLSKYVKEQVWIQAEKESPAPSQSQSQSQSDRKANLPLRQVKPNQFIMIP